MQETSEDNKAYNINPEVVNEKGEVDPLLLEKYLTNIFMERWSKKNKKRSLYIWTDKKGLENFHNMIKEEYEKLYPKNSKLL